jgi:hypothetical protein
VIVPTPIGVGPAYHPRPDTPAVQNAAPVGRFSCLRGRHERALAHVEVFARGRVVLLPAGIGVAPPLRWRGGYVERGRCSYAVRTKAPTGVVEFVAAARPTLGDLFAVWGQPLSSRRLGQFRTSSARPVRAWIGGAPWRSDVRRIPLRNHAQIVVELGAFVPPHSFFLFPR